MTEDGDALARAALELAGTRFRLHGRDPATGLDCAGLVTSALQAIGREYRLPCGYGLRNRNVAHLLPFAAAAGLYETEGDIAPGDVLLASPAPAQFHLLIAVPPHGFVHAHAGLRRVVATPGPSPWPIERHWRLIELQKEHR